MNLPDKRIFIQTLLSKVYNDDFKFHLLKPINDVLVGARSKALINLNEAAMLSFPKEELRRFYSMAETSVRLRNYAAHYAKDPLSNSPILLKHKLNSVLSKCLKRKCKFKFRKSEEAKKTKNQIKVSGPRLLTKLEQVTRYLKSIETSQPSVLSEKSKGLSFHHGKGVKLLEKLQDASVFDIYDTPSTLEVPLENLEAAGKTPKVFVKNVELQPKVSQLERYPRKTDQQTYRRGLNQRGKPLSPKEPTSLEHLTAGLMLTDRSIKTLVSELDKLGQSEINPKPCDLSIDEEIIRLRTELSGKPLAAPHPSRLNFRKKTKFRDSPYNSTMEELNGPKGKVLGVSSSVPLERSKSQIGSTSGNRSKLILRPDDPISKGSSSSRGFARVVSETSYPFPVKNTSARKKEGLSSYRKDALTLVKPKLTLVKSNISRIAKTPSFSSYRKAHVPILFGEYNDIPKTFYRPLQTSQPKNNSTAPILSQIKTILARNKSRSIQMRGKSVDGPTSTFIELIGRKH